MKDFRIDEIRRVVVGQRKFIYENPLPKREELDQKALEKGLAQSRDTCRQMENVFATPLAKNLLVVKGDVKQYFDEKSNEWKTEKLPCGKKSKAIDWINDVVHACLLKYNGKERHEYNQNLDVFDRDHYDVDCWNGWKSEVWDIQPGQAEQRKDTFKAYGNPKTNYSYEQLLRDLSYDESLQVAIRLMLAFYPEVCASHEVQDVSDPFLHKGSGVSYPFYHNDGTVVSDEDDITYGKYCVSLVEKAFKKGPKYFIKWAIKFLVATGYPRNQRGKGRALEAISRIYNIVINMVNANEIELIKKTPYGTGLKDFNGIKNDLIRLGEFCRKKGPEYGIYNLDGIQWDFNVGDGLNAVTQAIRKVKTNGTTGKMLCDLRALGIHKAWFVDGPNGKVHPIYGRMFSGYDDTTLGNTADSRLVTIAACCYADRKYAQEVYYPLDGGSVITLGDDILAAMKKEDKQKVVKYMEGKGIKLHNDDSKDAFGPFFVQYRVYEDKGSRKYVMGYNWPRVLRSMLSKENQKSLGKYGWTLAFYQQLSKCIEIDDAFMILVNIAAALDKDHLSLNVPIKEICHQVILEDEAKRASQKGGRKNTITTAELITGGNPQAQGVTADGKLDTNFFEEVQARARSVYNPNFLVDLGFVNPNLNLVH